MDQQIATIITALIAGVVSIVSLFVQSRQNKVIDKIDEQTTFIEKEKNTRFKLTQKEKERDVIIHEIMLLILDTNMMILSNTQIGDNISSEKFERSRELKDKYQKVVEEIEDIQKEYDIILDMTTQFRHELEHRNE